MQLTIADVFRYTMKNHDLVMPAELFPHRRLRFEFFTTYVGDGDNLQSLNFASPYNNRMVLQFQFVKNICNVIACYGQHGEYAPTKTVLCTFNSIQTEKIKDTVYKLCPWITKFRGDGLHIA